MGLKKIFLLLVAGFFAIAFSQFPEFQQQYKQRMGGTLDELNRQVIALDARAAEAGMERYDYIRHFLDNPDLVIQREGQNLSDMLGRRLRIRQAIDEMDNARGYALMITVIFHLDPQTAQATLIDYRPALPLTISGLLHGLFGFVLGYLLSVYLTLLLPRRVRRTSWSGGES